MLVLEDNYSHPSEDIHYIKESILGPGGDSEAFYTWFGITCNCSNGWECCNDNCKCLITFSKNYVSSCLIEDKINSEICVYECSAFCSCDKECCNKVVQRGPNPFLEIREVQNKGLGVFSLNTLKKGTFICEYAGEIIGKEEAVMRAKNENKSKYILALREHYSDSISETFVDASSFGNIGRYLNHSCDPNCILIPVRTGCLVPKVAIFACNNIESNEELSYCYCPGGRSLSQSKCYCKAKNCQGYLPLDDSIN